MRGPRHPRRHRAYAGNQRGSVLVLVTLSLVAVFSMLALAVDLGLRFTAHAEVQRAADAAALAGASAFMDPTIPRNRVIQRDEARRRAYEFALANEVLGAPIHPDEVEVDADSERELVRVTIRRTGVPVWFARILGVESAAVSARAAAQAATGGAANCLAPWAMVDFWDDRDDDDGDGLPDPNWKFDLGTDGYGRLADPGLETGLGSEFRNDRGAHRYYNDYGRPITLVGALPTRNPPAGQLYAWQLEGEAPNLTEYANRLRDCDPTIVETGRGYRVRNEVLSEDFYQATSEALDSVFRLDPDAKWEERFDPTLGALTGRVVSPYGMKSPRIFRIPLVDPRVAARQNWGGSFPRIPFNNMGLLFVESWGRDAQNRLVVHGRFLYYVPGADDTRGGTAPLIRHVQLVE